MKLIRARNWFVLAMLGCLAIITLGSSNDVIQAGTQTLAEIYHAGNDMGHTISRFTHRNSDRE